MCVGALHALTHHPTAVKRVAIVDIDVHHGNGTEEIVSDVLRLISLLEVARSRKVQILLFVIHYQKFLTFLLCNVKRCQN